LILLISFELKVNRKVQLSAFCSTPIFSAIKFSMLRTSLYEISNSSFVTDDVQRAFDKAVASGAMSLVSPLKKPWGQK
jgi:hypothetical protein